MQIVIFNVNDEQFAIEANEVEGINEILNIYNSFKEKVNDLWRSL